MDSGTTLVCKFLEGRWRSWSEGLSLARSGRGQGLTSSSCRGAVGLFRFPRNYFAFPPASVFHLSAVPPFPRLPLLLAIRPVDAGNMCEYLSLVLSFWWIFAMVRVSKKRLDTAAQACRQPFFTLLSDPFGSTTIYMSVTLTRSSGFNRLCYTPIPDSVSW